MTKGSFDVFALQDFFRLRLRFRGQIQMQIDFAGSQFRAAPESEVMIDGVIVADRTNQRIDVN